MIRRVAAVFAFLVVASGWLLAQDSPLPGPAGGFSGGTVPNATTFASPVVLTGDNSGGVGTLRIRPSDNDTHVVLCSADNNAATEMCTAFSHDNFSATQSTHNIITNGYLDSAGAVQRNWTSGGYVRTMQSAGSTANLNYTLGSVYGTGGSEAGYYHLQATGLTTATFQIGNTGTVTTDIRGPIINGGSATCNGFNSGVLCINDVVGIAANTATMFVQMITNTAGYASIQLQDNAATTVGNYAYYGSTYADADYADKVANVAVLKQLMAARTDDVAATAVFMTWMDNGSATGVPLRGIYGDGAQYSEDVTPTALSGAVNDYAGCTLSRCRISGGAADRNITGIANGADGKEFRICNIGTTNNLVLTDEDAGSVAANRFALNAAVTILPERCQLITYDSTSSRWRADQ